MRVRPRVVFATLVLLGTSCGLVYDVDSLSTDYKDCGVEGVKCCAKASCGDRLICMETTPDAGKAAPEKVVACDCADASTDAKGSDAQGGSACTCPPGVCRHCGNPGEICCSKGYACNNIEGLSCDKSGQCTGSCGDLGQACCNGALCNPDLKCSKGTCTSGSGGTGGSGGSGGTSGSGGSGGSGPCGNNGDPCCTSGPQCNSGSLKCDGTQHCQACGGEAQICCDNPTPCGPNLTCDGTNCRTCPWAGAKCGGDVSRVCMGVGDAGQCAACGGLGQPCCDGSAATPCPDIRYCCEGSGQGCVACTALPCTCKSCCIRCGNWAANSYIQIAANPGDCPQQGVNYCQNKGGKAYAQWGDSCP